METKKEFYLHDQTSLGVLGNFTNVHSATQENPKRIHVF